MSNAGLSPLDCNAVASNEDATTCSLQLGHGGSMHAGGDPLVWWTRDGYMVDFSKGCTMPDWAGDISS